ncbi:hypothetical protein [Cellulomonas shaoxiangyii]|uniref:Restriction endonuclease n=1 Tax=Cellulomonas shaoxiangyii TaxID=2566013 RepID=A0A4P7SES5_9CELL|nr:hypothetical protein [Cellulomonas shaoxiangyii]QCB92350.1 hypothetical protein E5225_01035 [Cellulomonas shaoxiangyii]TGY86255.1 hypothetical protein E5226_02830 [Cellulomonas shaoxiangyii]
MPDRHARFVRSALTDSEVAEVAVVDELARRLRTHLEVRRDEIDRVHVHRASSSAVQAVVGELLREIGFDEEVVLTPQDGFVTRARPDFVFPIADGRGIIAEVERGGTTTNNHDLKDFWKVHIAKDAQHLFLVVPAANWNEAGQARERPFARVAHRLAAFFGDARREVDVLSAHVFGYGSDAPAAR